MRKPFLLVSTFVFLSAIISGSALAQDSTAAKKVLGEWLTAGGTSKIEVYKEGEEFCGRISWLKEPDKDGKPKGRRKESRGKTPFTTPPRARYPPRVHV